MKVMFNTATASMNKNQGAFSSGQSKRKHEVIDLTADDDVVDLTGSPVPAPKLRKGSDFKLESAETSYRFPGGFRINPIKTEQGAIPSSSSVKQELGYESAPRFEPTTPRRDFSIRATNSGRRRNSSTRIKSEVRDSSHPILISSPTPPAHRPIQQRECTICYDTFDTDVLPLRPHATATADHTVCYGCWEKHLHSELERKEWDRLSCPDCGETMSIADICQLDLYFQERIEPKIMDKAAKSCLDQDPDWVDCPSGTCKSGALMTEGHIFTCQECLYRFCFSCKIPMHEGEACSEYHERLRREPEKLREEELSTKKVDEVSKGCPGCTARIQKNDGCDHMTCRRCKHEFCWICLADYGGPNGVNARGNDAHLDSCRYASRRLPNYRGPRL